MAARLGLVAVIAIGALALGISTSVDAAPSSSTAQDPKTDSVEKGPDAKGKTDSGKPEQKQREAAKPEQKQADAAKPEAAKKDGDKPDPKKPAPPKPIRCDSPEQLIQTVLTALEKKDKTTLHAVRVYPDEYESVIWPQLVEKKPHLAKQKPNFHWFMLETQSRAGVNDLLSDFGGKKLEFVSFQHDKIEDYKTFKAWRTVNVTFKVNGELTTERLFGAIIERDKKFYLLSYPS